MKTALPVSPGLKTPVYVTFKKNEVIMDSDELNYSLFIIKSGYVKETFPSGGEAEVEGHFGSAALLTDFPALATSKMIAASVVRLAVLTREDFLGACLNHDAASEVVRGRVSKESRKKREVESSKPVGVAFDERASVAGLASRAKGVFSPDSVLRHFWELVTVIGLIFYGLLIPVQVAFLDTSSSHFYTTLIISYIFDCFFLADIYMRMRRFTHLVVEEGHYASSAQITRKYFSRPWVFVYDVACLVPLELMFGTS